MLIHLVSYDNIEWPCLKRQHLSVGANEFYVLDGATEIFVHIDAETPRPDSTRPRYIRKSPRNDIEKPQLPGLVGALIFRTARIFVAFRARPAPVRR